VKLAPSRGLGRQLAAVALAAVVVTFSACLDGAPNKSQQSGPVATVGTPVRSDQWELTVTALRRAESLSGAGRTFEARRDETFLVVDVALRARTPGREHEVSSKNASLVALDGTLYEATGGGEDYVCADCEFDLTTDADKVALKLVFVLDEDAAEQSFAFRYEPSAAPVVISLSSQIDPRVATVAGVPRKTAPSGWTKITPAGKTLCARGDPFAFFVRRGQPGKLLIYFGGGGGCFDYASCAPESALFNDYVTEAENSDALAFGIFDAADPENPFRGYTIVYVPSCTGDVHIGNKKTTYHGVGGRTVPIEHRGFVNASAALTWAYNKVPRPQSVFVTGCSAGSIASIVFAPYVIERYPNARVTQLGDSNAFVFHRPVNLERDWRAHESFPAWILALDRIKPGSFTMARYYAAVARYYPRRVFAQFNFAEDATQRRFYEAVGGDPSDFPAALRASLEQIRRRAPNFRCYTAEGANHCILGDRSFYAAEANGVRLRDWVAGLAHGKPVEDVR
jgi:hypothetical protein